MSYILYTLYISYILYIHYTYHIYYIIPYHTISYHTIPYSIQTSHVLVHVPPVAAHQPMSHLTSDPMSHSRGTIGGNQQISFSERSDGRFRLHHSTAARSAESTPAVSYQQQHLNIEDLWSNSNPM